MLKETRFDVCTYKTRAQAETTEKQRKSLIKVEADNHSMSGRVYHSVVDRVTYSPPFFPLDKIVTWPCLVSLEHDTQCNISA